MKVDKLGCELSAVKTKPSFSGAATAAASSPGKAALAMARASAMIVSVVG